MKGKYFYLSMLCLIVTVSVPAQDFSKTMQEIEKIKGAYKAGGWLSYQMKYLYSKESAPAKYLDSLTGNFKMHDSSYYGKMAKIEFLQNATASIAVYNQDKIIMLNKPAKQEDKLMPLATWDSVFVAYNMDTTLITDKGNVRTLQFKFAPEANYKNFQIQYDIKTYRLTKLVITTKQVPVDNGGGQVKQDGNIVTILFSNYSETAFDAAVFSEKKYMQIEGGQWATTAAYNSYRLVDLRKEREK